MRLSVCRDADKPPGSGVGVVFAVAVAVTAALEILGSMSAVTPPRPPAGLFRAGLVSNAGDTSSVLGVGNGDILCLLRGPSRREVSR